MPIHARVQPTTRDGFVSNTLQWPNPASQKKSTFRQCLDVTWSIKSNSGILGYPLSTPTLRYSFFVLSIRLNIGWKNEISVLVSYLCLRIASYFLAKLASCRSSLQRADEESSSWKNFPCFAIETTSQAWSMYLAHLLSIIWFWCAPFVFFFFLIKFQS